MSVADAVQLAHEIIEKEDIKEENFDFLLYLCDFLGKEDKVGVAWFTFDAFLKTGELLIFQRFAEMSRKPCFPADSFANKQCFDTLIALAETTEGKLAQLSVFTMDSILSKSFNREFLMFTHFFQSLSKFSVVYDLSELIIALLISPEPIPGEAPIFLSAPIQGFIEGGTRKQQINAMKALASLFDRNVPFDKEIIGHCMDKFIQCDDAEIISLVIHLLKYVDEPPKQCLEFLLSKLSLQESVQTIVFILYKFNDAWSEEETALITNEILQKIDEFNYSGKRDSLMLLVCINDCSVYVNIELFQALVNFLENEETRKEFLTNIIKMIVAPTASMEEKAQMLSIVSENESLFDELSESDDEIISQLSLVLLDVLRA